MVTLVFQLLKMLQERQPPPRAILMFASPSLNRRSGYRLGANSKVMLA
jgi:hypothetical protein